MGEQLAGQVGAKDGIKRFREHVRAAIPQRGEPFHNGGRHDAEQQKHEPETKRDFEHSVHTTSAESSLASAFKGVGSGGVPHPPDRDDPAPSPSPAV